MVITDQLVEVPNSAPCFGSQVWSPVTVDVLIGHLPPQHGRSCVTVGVCEQVGLWAGIVIVLVLVGCGKQGRAQMFVSSTDGSQKSGLMVVVAL